MSDPVREALAELVALDDLRQKYSSGVPDSPRNSRWDEYQRDVANLGSRHRAAWAAARAALAQPAEPVAEIAKLRRTINRLESELLYGYRGDDQGTAQDAGHDSGRASGTMRLDANQHHEHRERQSGADRADDQRDSGGTWLQGNGAVRAGVAQPAEPVAELAALRAERVPLTDEEVDAIAKTAFHVSFVGGRHRDEIRAVVAEYERIQRSHGIGAARAGGGTRDDSSRKE